MAADEANQKATRKTNDVGPTGQTVAGNIQRLRQLRGLSTYRLSEILEEMGRPIAPSAISRIESGARKVDVDDLVVFAAALNVSPATLILPMGDGSNGIIEITGSGDVPADTAWSWLLAERPLDLPADDDGEAWNNFQSYSRPPGRRNYRGNRVDWQVVDGRPVVVAHDTNALLPPALLRELAKVVDQLAPTAERDPVGAYFRLQQLVADLGQALTGTVE